MGPNPVQGSGKGGVVKSQTLFSTPLPSETKNTRVLQQVVPFWGQKRAQGVAPGVLDSMWGAPESKLMRITNPFLTLPRPRS